MEETPSEGNEALDAVAAYAVASQASLAAARRLGEAWRRHFELQAEEPPDDLVAEVSALQLASARALERARELTKAAFLAAPAEISHTAAAAPVKVRRVRRRENAFLKTIGRQGQHLLRAILRTLLAAAQLTATAAGISLSLEIAGLLHMIEDPAQLPVGIQLGIFAASLGAVFALRRLLRPVDHALYGRKERRPKAFQL